MNSDDNTKLPSADDPAPTAFLSRAEIGILVQMILDVGEDREGQTPEEIEIYNKLKPLMRGGDVVCASPQKPGLKEAVGGELPRGVSIVLFRGGKFAVSQRLSKLHLPCLWQFAGGHVERGEEPLSAAQRELLEETGLALPAERFHFIGKAGPLVGYNGDKYIGHRYGVVLEVGEEPACTEPDKHTGWQWVTPQELLALEMLQAVKEFALTFALTPATPPMQPIQAHKDDNNGASILKASPRPWSLVTIPASGTGGDAVSYIPELREVYRDKAKFLHPDDAALVVAAVNAYSPPATGEGEPKCLCPHCGHVASACLSGLTTREVTDGLEYISTSPAPEFGGFHPNTVRICMGALEEITRLRAQLAAPTEPKAADKPSSGL